MNVKNLVQFAAIIGFATIAFAACQGESNQQHSTANKEQDGEALYAANCATCHAFKPQAPITAAPHMGTIKDAYFKKYSTQEAFVQAIAQYVAQPMAEKSLLPEAIKQYGIMAALSLPKTDIEHIAAFIYSTPIDAPAAAPDTTTPLGKGLSMAMKTKATLGKQLTQSIEQKGTREAMAFCSTQALPLTDSMGKLQQALIRRVSDKPRNPANAANAEELEVIAEYKRLLFAGKERKPTHRLNGGKHTVYVPIETTQMCLQCHGSKKANITEEVFQAITKRYPKDKATGYKAGEVRGIFVVQWPQ